MRGNESDRRARAALGWHWARRFLAVVTGVWVAVLLVLDFRLHGSAGGQALAVAGIAAVLIMATTVVPMPVDRWLRGAGDRNMRAMAAEPALYASDREFFAPARRAMWLGVAGMVVRVVVTVVVLPAALWAAAWLGAKAGVPVLLSGLWPTLVAALVIAAISGTAESLLDSSVGRSRGRRAVRVLVAYGLALGGFGLAVAVLDGVRLEQGPFARQLLTLVVLVGLFLMMSLELTVPFVTVLLTVAVAALKLWLLSWFSTGLELTLQIGGFVNFVLAALIVTVAIGLPALADRARTPPPAPAPLHDPLRDLPPMGPYY